MQSTKQTACESVIVDKSIYYDYKGIRIYFCEKFCREEFIQNPEKFISSEHFSLKLPVLANQSSL